MTETIGDWERRTGYERLAEQIDSLPETAEPDIAPVEDVSTPVVLMDRSYAGLLVELRWLDGDVSILVREGDDGKPQVTSVPPEKALDAFQHPYCYLAS